MITPSLDAHLFPYELKGQGAPLLCISGLGTNYTIWKPLVGLLNTENTTVAIAPQQIINQEISDKDLFLKSQADNFQKFISELSLEAPCLIGHSTGAAVAAAYAYYHPDKVKKLILINPFMKIDFVRLVFLSALEKIMDKSLKEETIELLMPWIFSRVFLSNSESVQEFIKASDIYFCLRESEDIKQLVNFLSNLDISSILPK